MVFLKINEELIINAKQITEIDPKKKMVRLSSGTCLYLTTREFEKIKTLVKEFEVVQLGGKK